MPAPNPPLILPPFNQATARLKVQIADDAWNTREPSHGNEHWELDEASGLMRRPDAGINDHPTAPFERRIALP